MNILINGAQGRMGQVTVKAVEADPDLHLVGTCNRGDDLFSAIKETKAEIVIDLTNAAAVFENASTIIEAGVHPVIGTSGLQADQIEQLTARSSAKNLGGIILPNSSIGAVLMMKLAEIAAPYFQHATIIEKHHEKKMDAPSGTAMKTAAI